MIWITFLLITTIAAIGLHADRLVTVLVAFGAIVIIYVSLIAKGVLQ